MDIAGIIKDSTGEVENEIRLGIGEAEDVLKGMIEDHPDFTTGEAALAFGVAYPPQILGWFVAVLLRDRVELGV